MSIPDPSRFFDRADRLTISPSPGPTRQVHLRRAVSAASHGAVHFTCAALADHVVGAAHRSWPRHALVYRSLDRRVSREICQGIVRATPPPKLASHLPPGGFGRDMIAFCDATLELQDRRHRADCDPTAFSTGKEGQAFVAVGRSAVRRFRASAAAERAMFPILLCPPR